MSVSRRDKLAAEKRLCERIAGTFSTGHAQVRCGVGGVCDVVTERFAIEVEPCASWQTGLGQALTYSVLLERRPLLWIIEQRRGESERRLPLMMRVLRAVNMPFVVQGVGFCPAEAWLFYPPFDLRAGAVVLEMVCRSGNFFEG